jgi:hypothetical protein
VEEERVGCPNDASEFLRDAVTNILLSHRLFPVEAYEFPQEEVAEFWKEVFADRGIKVFGKDEVPADMHKIQMDFALPDHPPAWLIER